MSKKLYQRGRYPKSSSLYNNPVAKKQEQPATVSGTTYMQPSNVPLYNQQPPENNVWNWMPENNSGNSNSNNNRSTVDPPQFQQHQGNVTPGPSHHISSLPSPVSNTEMMGYVEQSINQPANSPYVMQNNFYQQNAGDNSNQNGNQYNSAVYQQEQSNWEALPQPISQAVPWTYSAPQIAPIPSQSMLQWPSVKVPNSSSGVKNDEMPEPVYTESNPVLHSDTGQVNQQNANSYLQVQSTSNEYSQQPNNFAYPPAVHQYVDQHSFVHDDNLENLESCSSNNVINTEVMPIVQGGLDLGDPESGAISAFFHNSIEEEEQQRVADANNENALDDQLEVENVSDRVSNSVESPVVQNLEADENHVNIEEINQQYQIAQTRNDSFDDCRPNPAHPSNEVPDLAVEEPLNQEVPEPNDLSLYNTLAAHPAKQPVDDQSSDDHLNQQIPAESSNIVQQESQSQKPNSKLLSHDDSIIQEVNLETVPDNLERPPDHEELKKHSSWHSLHRHHLRDDHENTLSLSSTSLWDSPDIPHITLVAAAPLPPVSIAPPAVNVTNDSPALNTSEENSTSKYVPSSSDISRNSQITSSQSSSPEHSNQVVSNKPNLSSDISSIPNQEDSSIQNLNVCDRNESSQDCVERTSNHDRHSPSHESKSPISVSSGSQHDDSSRKSREKYFEHDNSRKIYNEKNERRSSYHKDDSNNERYSENIEKGDYEKGTERRKYNDKNDEKKYDRDFERYRKEGNFERRNDRDRYESKYYRRGFDDERYEERELDRYGSYERRPEKEQKYQQQYNYETNRDFGPRANRREGPSSRPSTTELESSRSLGYQSDFADKNSDRYKYDDERFRNIDQRTFASREGSRPPSRMSLNEPVERHPFREIGYQKPYMSDNERPSSRMSESEAHQGRETGSHSYYDRRYRDPYQRDEDYYRKDRTYPGYDYDPYQMTGYPYYGYYPYQQQNYSRYNYGYYDELYRNDPRYRQQVDEQYRDYYRRMGYETDVDRSSVHSGHSSVTEMSKETSQRYPDGGTDISYNQQSYGYSERPSQFSSFDVSDDQLSVPAARLTPAKFTCAHPFANFSADGKLFVVVPKRSGHPSTNCTPLVEIHDMQALMQNLESSEELKKFPGPLVRGESHKSDLIEFCLNKVKLYKQKEGIPDRESYILLWELLVLLLRQNGSVAGSDIAELLLKDHEILHQSQFKNNLVTPNEDSSPVDGIVGGGVVADASSSAHSGDTSSPDEGIFVSRDRTVLNTSLKMDVDKVTRKFREFLMFGHKKDALEWAMKHGLWGHALFLASKMDLRTYANIMTRFANSLAINDPLQTLYQLMSGRQPAAVTCVSDKNWGDWRPHLAMILSNPSTHAEVDSKSITTLGDTLAAQGCLPAAHFCYLMSQVDFGYYSQKTSKLVLLGADHRLPFKEFATNEAIQCTEIYEYAQSLANPGFILNHFQGYKFIYATRLLDHGYFQEALHYCEVLASGFTLNPDPSHTDIISQVYELSCRLKYYDPHYLQGQGEVIEQEDPGWISELSDLLNNLKHGILETTSTEQEEVAYTEQNADNSYSQEGVEAATPQPSQPPETPNVAFYTPQAQPYYQQNSMWQSSNSNSVQPHQVPQQILQSSQQVSEIKQPPNNAMTSQYVHDASSNQWNHSVQATQENSSLDLQQQQQYVSPSAIPATTNFSTSPTQSYNRFDFHSTELPQVQGIRSTNRERTNSTSSLGFQRDRHDSTVSSGSDYAAGHSATSSRKASEVVKEDKIRPQVGRSWLGGIFSRLLPKAPNQMILPDDKNPTIVWDPVTKRWVNMDSNDEDETSTEVSPPTDSELMKKSSFDNSKPSVAPAVVQSSPSMPPATAASAPTVNKYQRIKVKGNRQHYIDVLNPGATSTTKPIPNPEILYPTMMPMQQQNPTNLLVPSAPVPEDAPTDFVSSGQPVLSAQNNLEDDQETVSKAPPLMFDPAEFDSRRASMSSTRHGVGPSRRTYPT